MIINNSKKALAAKIRNSGFVWPDSGKWAIQDKDGEVFVCSGTSVPVRRMGEVNWEFGEPYGSVGILSLGSNWFQCILSRDEYFHLHPAPDADGWIEWKGGGCPVEKGTLIDVRYRDGHEQVGCECGVWRSELYGTHYWLNSGGNSNIIAYRLHKPEDKVAAKPECTVIDPEPTIEQLAAEYRNRKDYAERKQQEADAAKAEAEVKLSELVAAGKAVWLVVSVAEPETELVITDWRDLQVGDEIEYLGGTTRNWIGRKGVVELIGGKDKYPILFRDGEEGASEDPRNWDSTRWCNDFKFIRRPAKENNNA